MAAAAPITLPPSVSGAMNLPPNPDISKFHCLYPIYLDKAKTLTQGRRLPLSAAVPSPNMREIVESCKELRIPIAAEVRRVV